MRELETHLRTSEGEKPRQIILDADAEVYAWDIFQVLKAVTALGVRELDVAYEVTYPEETITPK